MIVAVKRNKKQKFIKLISLIVLVLMFVGYFYHMNETYAEKQRLELEEKQALKLQEENSR